LNKFRGNDFEWRDNAKNVWDAQCFRLGSDERCISGKSPAVWDTAPC